MKIREVIFSSSRSKFDSLAQVASDWGLLEELDSSCLVRANNRIVYPFFKIS